MSPAPAAKDGTKIVEASFVAGAKAPDQLPPPVSVEVAFAGRSNVGKSSLLNCLLERKNLVRTSSTPGCTRQISFYQARSADGAVATLVDLPGYGYAKRSKSERAEWAHLIESYLLQRPTLSMVVLLVDVRRGIEQDDRDLLELLQTESRNRRPVATLIVGTKLDRLPVSQRKLAVAQLKASGGKAALGFSAKDGTGRDELWRRIKKSVGLEAVADG